MNAGEAKRWMAFANHLWPVNWLAIVRWSTKAGVFVTNLALHIARFGELTIAGQGK